MPLRKRPQLEKFSTDSKSVYIFLNQMNQAFQQYKAYKNIPTFSYCSGATQWAPRVTLFVNTSNRCNHALNSILLVANKPQSIVLFHRVHLVLVLSFSMPFDRMAWNERQQHYPSVCRLLQTLCQLPLTIKFDSICFELI